MSAFPVPRGGRNVAPFSNPDDVNSWPAWTSLPVTTLDLGTFDDTGAFVGRGFRDMLARPWSLVEVEVADRGDDQVVEGEGGRV